MSNILIIATANSGKLNELHQMLQPFGLTVASQSDYQVTEVKETGLSFVENALLKARNASQCTGFPAIADDSGIVVDALNGAPGIYSARYAGIHASDSDNLEKLILELQGITPEKRTARFVSVMVYVRHAHDPLPIIAQGIWEGSVIHEPRGENGFGYDPIFFIDEEGCTAAELSQERKNQLSHRGKALRKLIDSINSIC